MKPVRLTAFSFVANQLPLHRPIGCGKPARRPQVAAAGLLWAPIISAPGNHRVRSSGVLPARFTAGSRTLLALDLELNENNPSNSMRLDQAEAWGAADGLRAVFLAMPTLCPRPRRIVIGQSREGRFSARGLVTRPCARRQ
jgi:hypothetical protein